MGKDVRRGFLTFYKSTQNRDFQLLGYYNNWILGLKYVPRDTLVSFFTPDISGELSAPSEMKLRKINIINGEINVISEQIITSGLQAVTKTKNGEIITSYYRQQGIFTETPSEYLTQGCIYDIYIIDSNNNEFVSDIFLAISLTDIYYYTEDGQIITTEDGEYIVWQ